MLTKIAVLAFATGGAGALGMGAYSLHDRAGGFCGRFGAARSEMVHKFVDFAISEKLDEIDATAEQRQKVREVKERLMKEGHALREGKDELRQQLLEAWAQDEPDAARVKALVRQRVNAFAAFADDATDAMLELHSTFTPAQRAKLLEDARQRLASHRH